ncbi:hypothetical protein SDC9_195053 [bioreactor metagenome]|uniref:Uncharacterized protein n=1 Tax=bioreactor metagenome TaxID=1076179 RepID=A0A645I7Z5_9ZZZZ
MTLFDCTHAHALDNALLEDCVDRERRNRAHEQARILERRIAGVAANQRRERDHDRALVHAL